MPNLVSKTNGAVDHEEAANGITVEVVEDRDERTGLAWSKTKTPEKYLPRPNNPAALSVWQRYRFTIRFTGKLCGGIPADPELMEAWLRAKAGITDEEELRALVVKTLGEIGMPVPPDGKLDKEQLDAAVELIAEHKGKNVFKRDKESGLYIEGRQVKALWRESVNIQYAGEKWGVTRKGARSFFNERCHVEEDRIYLGRTEADGTDLVVGHVPSPTGQHSTLSRVEYVEGATVAFTVSSYSDSIPADVWSELAQLGEYLGLGSGRSMGHGRFEIVKIERLPIEKRPDRFTVIDAAE